MEEIVMSVNSLQQKLNELSADYGVSFFCNKSNHWHETPEEKHICALERLAQQIQELNDERSDLEASLESQAEEYEDKLCSLRDKAESYEYELGEKISECEALEEDNGTLQSRVDELESQVMSLEEELESIKHPGAGAVSEGVMSISKYRF